jgi:hypothetical protein
MRKMDLKELAQYTYQGLKKQGISVTLSGGACVSIYTENAYQSIDLDFIREIHETFKNTSSAMDSLGFVRTGRRFNHPQSEFYVEFPAPPLTVGEEAPKEVREYIIRTSLGDIGVKMLSPTDCVKDRLCAFFHWNDRQSLDQAFMVASSQKVDRAELKRWAENEGMEGKYEIFLTHLKKKAPRKKQVRQK